VQATSHGKENDMKVTIGIDPGKNGAVAVLSPSGAYTETFEDESVGNVLSTIIRQASIDGYPVECFVEAVHSFPGQGVASAFSFGRAFGEIIGALDALKAPYRLIQPQAWQKGITALPKKKDGATAHKRALKQEAQRRFPDANITLKNCDALLIADYGRRL
jgi:crossover junction endodeoxyribonuclease RuvC